MVHVTFDNPIFLIYLLAVPLLIYAHFYSLKRTKLKAVRFANFEALRRATGESLVTKNLTILYLRLAVLLCMILAITGTTVWYEGKVSKSDIVIAIDVSASMAAQDITPTRLEAAKQVASELVDGLPGNARVGLITFSGTTFVEKTLTDDRGEVKARIADLEIAMAGGTDIPGAIITGTNLLSASPNGRSIIIITDGSSTVSAFLTDSLKESLSYAFDNQVIISAMGIGSDTGPIGYLPEYYNISAVYNEDALLEITNATNGLYFKINANQDLAPARDEINKNSTTGNVAIRLSYWLLLASFILLFIEWGLLSTRFRRIP